MGIFSKNNEGEHKGGRLKQAFETAKPALHLSPDQEAQIQSIFKDFREERKELKTGGGEDAREAIRSARKGAKQKILDVLNDDQRQVLEQHLS